MLWCGGLRGSMKCEWTHQEGVAFFRQTSNLTVGDNMVLNFSSFQNPMTMSAGSDAQWTVRLIAVVQMKAND